MAGHEGQQQEHVEEVVQRNVEQSRELLEAKHREQEQREAEPPQSDDSLGSDQQVIPGQDNVSAGGTTGAQMNLGGGFRSGRKRQG